MRTAFKLLCALTLTTLGAAAPALADVPTEMSVQGRLTNGAGAPVPAGIKLFTFKIYDAPAGGIEIWPGGPGETQALSTDANGLWNAGVGELIPLTEAVFQNPVRWLEVTVNDGVNPIETLPRIELRTNPYTYRAATSQQADSLAGNSLGDIADMFVDEAADTMSGQLRIDWSHANDAEPNFEIDNLSNAYAPPWNPFAGTWAGVANAHSDNGSFNVALAGSAQGDNTANQGVIGVAVGDNCVNWGLYGSAIGTGSSNYGLYAEAVGGTNNFAGYFAGPVGVTTTPGDQSVQLPADAISSTELLNEPGIAQGVNTAPVFLSTTSSMSDIVSTTITIPAAGFIVVEASSFMTVMGITGINFIWFQIDETAGGFQEIGYFNVAGSDNVPNTSAFYYPCSTRRTYYKTAGSYTFRLEALPYTASGTRSAEHSTITATYYPTSYGTVSTVASSGETGEFSSVTMAPKLLSGGAAAEASNQGDLYYVDLRELELKVAKAEAEAEKARRELAEAQLSATVKPISTPGMIGVRPNR